MPRKKKRGRPKLTEFQKKKRAEQLKKKKQEYYKNTVKPKLQQEKAKAQLTPKQQQEEKRKQSIKRQKEQLNSLTGYLRELIDYNFDQHINERRKYYTSAPTLRDTIPNLQFSLSFINNRFYNERNKYFLSFPSPKDNTKIEKNTLLRQIITNYEIIEEFFKLRIQNAVLGTEINDILEFLLLKPRQQIFLQNAVFRVLLDNLSACAEFINKEAKEKARMFITEHINTEAFNQKYKQQQGVIFTLYTPISCTNSDVNTKTSLQRKVQNYYIAIDRGFLLQGEDYTLWQKKLEEECNKLQVKENLLHSPTTPKSLKSKIVSSAITKTLSNKLTQLHPQEDKKQEETLLTLLGEKSKNINYQDVLLFTPTNNNPSLPTFRSEEANTTFLLQLYSSYIKYIKKKNTKLKPLKADLPTPNNQTPIPTQYLSQEDSLYLYKMFFIIYTMLFVFPLPDIRDTLTFQEDWQYIFEEDGLIITKTLNKIKRARTLKTQIKCLSEVFSILSLYINICFFPLKAFHFIESEAKAEEEIEPIELIEKIALTKLVDYRKLKTNYDVIIFLENIFPKIIPIIDYLCGFEGC